MINEGEKPFFMPIEDVFSISGRGTVVTGSPQGKMIEVGDEVEIVGIKDTQNTTVTGVEMFMKLLDPVQTGDTVGILLRETKKEEVEPGQVLAEPGTIKSHARFFCSFESDDDLAKSRDFIDESVRSDYPNPSLFNIVINGKSLHGVIYEPETYGEKSKVKFWLDIKMALEIGNSVALTKNGRTLFKGNVIEFLD